MSEGYLKVAEIYSIVGQGTTSPIFGRLSNLKDAYIKYPNNPWGNFVLINEVIGYSISKELSVLTPQWGLCELNESAIIIDPNEIDDTIDSSNCGTCFYSEAITKAIPFDKALTNMAKYKSSVDASRIIMVDCLVGNADRHSGNVLRDFMSDDIYVIDYSHICDKRHAVIKENKRVYDDLCRWFGYNSDSLALCVNDIKEKDWGSVFNNIKSIIPQSWTDSVKKDYINQCFSYIKYNIRNVDSIVEDIRKSREDSNG